MRKSLTKQPPAALSPVPAVKVIQQVAQPMPVPAVMRPSPMARPPVAKTQRVIPSAKTPRGVVRTDTHNQANQLPASAKWAGRGKP